MLTETIDLYDYFKIKKPENARAVLRSYIHYQSEEFCAGRVRPAILVMGGGTYYNVSDREKEPVALAFLAQGFNSFTLEYSVFSVCPQNHAKFPTQLQEACMAVAYIRENAKKYYIDPNKIAATGFSAGGHLLGTLATMYDAQEVKDALKEKVALCRPDAAVFCYSVISTGEKTHGDSMRFLCDKDPEVLKRVSIENNVNKNTPPAFIWATVNDGDVPSENSLLLAAAYKKNNVPFELHLFGDGVHGLSLCDKETAFVGREHDLINDEVKPWFALAVSWLKKQGFEIKF